MNKLCMALLMFFAVTAHAVTIEKPLENPALEQQARLLFSQLKCVVCEGQPLAESDAELALDMRAIIRTKLTQGETPQAITDYFTARYGDAILLSPPASQSSLALWLIPLVILLLGVFLLRRTVRV